MAVILISIPLTILIIILFYVFTKIFKKLSSFAIFCGIIWAIFVVIFYNGVISQSIKEVDNMNASSTGMYYILLYALTFIIPTVVLGCLFGIPALLAGYLICVKPKPVVKAPKVQEVKTALKKKEPKIFMTAKEERDMYDFTLLTKRSFR